MIKDGVANASKKTRNLDFYYVVPVASTINVTAAGRADEIALAAQFPDEGKTQRVFFVGIASGNNGESFVDTDFAAPLAGTLFLPSDSDPLNKAVVAHAASRTTPRTSRPVTA